MVCFSCTAPVRKIEAFLRFFGRAKIVNLLAKRYPKMIDPQAQTLINQMSAFGASPLSSMSPVEVRQQYLVIQTLQGGEPEPVNQVQDRDLPGLAGNIPVRIYTPHGSEPFPILVYFHGGGFVIGNIATHDPLCRTLANEVECIVVSVDYRLAPEHKFPAAVDDAYAATQWVAANAAEINGDPRRIAVGGDSAGGNLATVVALKARDQGEPIPIYQVLIYPVTDATQSQPSYEEYQEGYLLTKDNMSWFFSHYLSSDTDVKNPYLSPLWAPDVQGLPPGLVITAEFDPLRDEGEAYATRLQAAGIPVVCSRYSGMIHGFCLMSEILDQGKKAIAEVVAALRTAFIVHN